MSEIKVGENETLESALRRFKKKCARAGVLSEVRKREHYEKPSVKKKKKSEAARKPVTVFDPLLPFVWKARVSALLQLVSVEVVRHIHVLWQKPDIAACKR